jgi:hypothetical protein
MLEINKNKLIKYQTLVQNNDQLKGIPNFLGSYLKDITLVMNFILRKEMLLILCVLMCSVYLKESLEIIEELQTLLLFTSRINIKSKRPVILIHKRSMVSSLYRKIRPPVITQHIRKYACVHGGDFKHNAKKPRVKDTDLTSKHKKVVETTCPQTECKKINCADSGAPAVCSRTPTQNQNSIPPTKQGFKTKLKGNTTSHVPPGKIKVVIDPHINYKGQPKAQEMVGETADVTVDSKDIKLDKNVTAYLQQQDHHDAITK